MQIQMQLVSSFKVKLLKEKAQLQLGLGFFPLNRGDLN
ncbi:hypothetical protein DCCM_4746 [Desulfocucumis palustris]|uniref:Uncharacterized protein n=1 Tax=Desulfocucumis palustris TaxID=1898651 RepID=A0A2L2XGX7_9FIRM|nr:hypothetical protein DCCM_4746 [Desulfocucumis palustris]